MKPRVFHSDKAQGLVEYALLLMLIALALIVALNFLGGGVYNAMYHNIIGNL
jgi:Flp pilus assembly pilin Flp